LASQLAAPPFCGHSLFERALDALPDGVLLTDARRKVIYANPAFARHWNIPTTVITERDEAYMLQFVQGQLVDPAAFICEVERINPTHETSQDDLHLKDGRVFSRRSVPVGEEGRFEARLWIFTDITEARAARVDLLCGLPNRRAYATDFPSFVEQADDGMSTAVGIMDIDNFKAYNDRYGHAAGDIVLRQIGRLLKRELRVDDLVFRIGGEEFLLACRIRTPSDALALFEALRASVAAMALPHLGNAPYDVVTASFGLGVFKGPNDPDKVFNSIDLALYRAKDAGRNTVCFTDI